MTMMRITFPPPLSIAALLLAGVVHADDAGWTRHTIDDSSRGADGIRLADVNGDGQPDVVTVWEEGGVIRVYLHPGTDGGKVTQPWPAVTVGKVKSPEDAVFADLDGDGAVDVVSSCEGKTQCMFAHWAPGEAGRYLNADAWQTEPIPASRGVTRWMFALPLQLDGKGGVDLVVASKAPNALVGWLQAPDDPRELAEWKLRKLYAAGWIMSLAPCDVDRDGDVDVVVSDRKGKQSGVLWLENPGPEAVSGDWPVHRIGANRREVMFLDVADLDGDRRMDILVAVKRDEVHWFTCPDDPRRPWPVRIVKATFPAGAGTAKAVRTGDLDGDGDLDIVYSCEHAGRPKRGLFYLESDGRSPEPQWTPRDISGPAGVKFDLMQLEDLDGDGDLDVLCCEERENLGVFWFENPHKGK